MALPPLTNRTTPRTVPTPVPRPPPTATHAIPATPAPPPPDVLAQHPVASVIIGVLMLVVLALAVTLVVWLVLRARRKLRAKKTPTTFTIVSNDAGAPESMTTDGTAQPSAAAASPQRDRAARLATLATYASSLLLVWSAGRLVFHLRARTTIALLAPLIILGAASLILYQRAKRSAPETERGFLALARRAMADKKGRNASLFVGTYALGSILSVLYRFEAGSFLEKFAYVVLIFVLAFARLPTVTILVTLGIVILALAQFYFLEVYWAAYRKVFCKYFPDMMIQAPGSSIKQRKGRVWKRIPKEDGGEVVLFAMRGWGIFQWWKGLQSLTLTKAEVMLVREKRGFWGPTLLIFAASDLAFDAVTNDWSLTSDGFSTQPLSENGAVQVMRHLTKDNAEVSKHGLEGNPYHLAFKSEGAGGPTSRVDNWDLGEERS